MAMDKRTMAMAMMVMAMMVMAMVMDEAGEKADVRTRHTHLYREANAIGKSRTGGCKKQSHTHKD
jgi:hypothetical protein